MKPRYRIGVSFFIRICVKDRSGSPKVERERNCTATAESLTAAEVWSRWHAQKKIPTLRLGFDIVSKLNLVVQTFLFYFIHDSFESFWVIHR